jgi:probable HAF family extracellular repeat protein
MKHFSIWLLAAAMPVSSILLGQSYLVVDLGAGSANDINNSGHVVGNAGRLGFLHDGISRRLLDNLVFNKTTPPPGDSGPPVIRIATDTSANAINDAGQIVGSMQYSDLVFGPPAGYLISEAALSSAQAEPEVVRPSFNLTVPTGINSSGRIVGWTLYDAGSPGQFIVGFVWGGGTDVELGHRSQLNAINDSNVAVGSFGQPVPPGPSYPSATYGSRAITVSATGTITNLDIRLPNDLGGSLDILSEGTAINASGIVVGAKLQALGGARHAFRHTGSDFEDLGTLGGTNSVARDINADGVIVGEAQLADGSFHAFRYTAGTMVDLNTLLPASSGWELLSANAINNRGEIVGQGRFEGQLRAYKLTLADLVNPPGIQDQPAGARLALAATFTLTVSATGATPFSYQWTLNGTNIANATNATYVITSASANDVGDYRALVSNIGGTTPSLVARVDVLDPELTAESYVGLKIVGAVGATYRIEFQPVASAPAWTTVTNIVLTSSPQRWVDLESYGQPGRIYRAVRVP